jgi:hypothetical protein
MVIYMEKPEKFYKGKCKINNEFCMHDFSIINFKNLKYLLNAYKIELLSMNLSKDNTFMQEKNCKRSE